MSDIRVGFIGLGNMGTLMCKIMLARGVPLLVYDLRQEAIEQAVGMGAKAARSSREVAASSDAVFSMVRDVPETEEVIFGKGGIWEGIDKGGIILLSSSISPAYCRQVSDRVKEKGVHLVDAAVSAESRVFTPGKEWAELTLMVGGDKEPVQRCMPVFEKLAKNVFHLGEVGTGAAGKLVNNLAMYGNAMVARECLNLGVKAGLDLNQLIDLIKVSTGYSRSLNTLGRQIREPRQAPPPPTTGKAPVKDLGTKDNELAMEIAEAAGARTPIARFMMNEVDIKAAYEALDRAMGK